MSNKAEMLKNEDGVAVLTLKTDFDNVTFSDMDKVYYRSINNISQETVVLVKNSDNTVKDVWWN